MSDDEENKTTDDIDETQTSEEGDTNESKATATAAPHKHHPEPRVTDKRLHIS